VVDGRCSSETPPAVARCQGDVPDRARTIPSLGDASHYDTLGLTPAATHEEVRRAYIQRALRYHPDRQEGQDLAGRADAERRMQDANLAWSVLGDRDARAAYDAQLGIARPEDDLDDVVPVDVGPVTLRDLVRRWSPLWILLGLLAAIFLFTAYAGGPPPS
jgi:hypothetical protein